MPSDSNGVYSLPSGYNAVTGETIQASQHNPPLEDLGSAMSARLMRSGAAPMTGPLKLPDGSVGSPAMQFSNGSSTGVYRTANGIGFAVAGTKVAELVSGGFVTGGRFLGELIPITRLTAPDLTVLPYGQTLSRTTYAALWALAQTEIAAGNTFYNNGDGSTTFGIGDCRGRTLFGWDKMGGTSADRLTGLTNGIDGDTVGATGGKESAALVQANLPSLDFTVTIPAGQGSHTHSYSGGTQLGNATGQSTAGSQGTVLSPGTLSINNATLPAMSGTAASGGSGTAFNTLPPGMVCNFLLFAGA